MKKESKFFTDALADANEIKEVAMANAKLAISEAINPALKTILESALADEMEDDEEEGDQKEESVLEKLQGLGLDEETMAKLTSALQEKAPKEDQKETEEGNPEDEEEIDETIDIDAALAEVESSMKPKEGDEEVKEGEMKDDEEDTDHEGGLSEEEINKILEGMDDDDEEAEDEKEEEEDPKEAAILELKSQLAEAKKAVKAQQEVLKEVNSLYAKVTYLSKFLIKESLNDEQKARIVKAFDKVKTAGEAQVLFEALNSKITPKTKTITESLGFVKANKTVVNETKKPTWSPEAIEMQRRAGIIK